MSTLSPEFASAVRNVTVNDEKRARAINAHTEVRELLEADAELSDWGIDSVLIGSYKRQTARYPGKDVDVFLRFTELSARHSPDKIYNAVERALSAEYGLKDQDPDGRLTRQSRSLKIDFPDPNDDSGDGAFAIDAVPAVPWHTNWGIPNRDRDQWSDDENRWIETNPVKFAEDTNALATAVWSPTVGEANAYRPINRLLRQTRQVHLGTLRPGGLFTEIAAYYVWTDQLVTGTSWAELLASTLKHVAARFEQCAGEGLLDPVLETALKPELEPWQWMSACETFTRLANQAAEALDSEPCRAAKIWRDILGTNERGQVLPLPNGCDAAGFPIGAATAVDAVGSDQPRGFALSRFDQ
jgi:hypothetical protein